MPFAPDPTAPVQRRALATLLGTCLGNAWLFLSTPPLAVLGMLLGWLTPRGDGTFWVARLWSHGWLLFAGVRRRLGFTAELEAKKAYLFVANHQSYIDVPLLITTLPGQTRFLAKAELFRIPLFGWALSAGSFVPVERGSREGAKRTYAAALATLDAGCSILLFPEQTRSADGRLRRFKHGAARMALATGYPIVPVGIRGTRQIQPRDTLVTTAGPAEIRYGAPIDPAGFDPEAPEVLTDAVRAAIVELAGDPAMEPESTPEAWSPDG